MQYDTYLLKIITWLIVKAKHEIYIYTNSNVNAK